MYHSPTWWRTPRRSLSAMKDFFPEACIRFAKLISVMLATFIFFVYLSPARRLFAESSPHNSYDIYLVIVVILFFFLPSLIPIGKMKIYFTHDGIHQEMGLSPHLEWYFRCYCIFVPWERIIAFVKGENGYAIFIRSRLGCLPPHEYLWIPNEIVEAYPVMQELVHRSELEQSPLMLLDGTKSLNFRKALSAPEQSQLLEAPRKIAVQLSKANEYMNKMMR